MIQRRTCISSKRRNEEYVMRVQLSHFLLPNHFCACGLRCGHPGQQHGLFFPFCSSSQNRRRCSERVVAFLTIVIQQIHSLRARGVSAFHRFKTSFFEVSRARKSLGTRCTVPELIFSVAIRISIAE